MLPHNVLRILAADECEIVIIAASAPGLGSMRTPH
jgi:hypothetical protein